ncbi:MAG: hypothetical protein RJA81_1645 [Planctomycetota bacterium]
MNPPTNTAMVWYQGQVLPWTQLTIPASDGAFEHGLGLFESIRYESGRVPLWELHLERLRSSADELGLQLTKSQIPDLSEVASLVNASAFDTNSVRLRMVLTAGSPNSGSRLWISSHPLSPVSNDNLRIAGNYWPVDSRDRLVRHKTLNYWLRRRAYEQATAAGFDEILSEDFDGNIWEGSRTSLILIKNSLLIFPEAGGPYLPSVASRALETMVKRRGEIGICHQRIKDEDLEDADEILLANALRGLLSVCSWRSKVYPSPGPVSQRLREQWHHDFF